jgi:hypothetical protein
MRGWPGRCAPHKRERSSSLRPMREDSADGMPREASTRKTRDPQSCIQRRGNQFALDCSTAQSRADRRAPVGGAIVIALSPHHHGCSRWRALSVQDDRPISSGERAARSGHDRRLQSRSLPPNRDGFTRRRTSSADQRFGARDFRLGRNHAHLPEGLGSTSGRGADLRRARYFVSIWIVSEPTTTFGADL